MPAVWLRIRRSIRESFCWLRSVGRAAAASAFRPAVELELRSRAGPQLLRSCPKAPEKDPTNRERFRSRPAFVPPLANALRAFPADGPLRQWRGPPVAAGASQNRAHGQDQ